MPSDFTLEKYNLLLDTITKYKVFTVHDYLTEKPSKNFLILRHDVDRRPKNALRMAKLEKERGILTSYYFRVGSNVDETIISEIYNMGHETGYHYEVLSKTKGNKEIAMQLFQKELSVLRSICKIDTACRHGLPLSNIDNLDLWDEKTFSEQGIIGDADASIKNIPYFTDSGRSWDGSHSIRDLPKNKDNSVSIKTTDDIINMLKNKNTKSVYFNIHPERWSARTIEWLMFYGVDFITNKGKSIVISLKKVK